MGVPHLELIGLSVAGPAGSDGAGDREGREGLVVSTAGQERGQGVLWNINDVSRRTNSIKSFPSLLSAQPHLL